MVILITFGVFLGICSIFPVFFDAALGQSEKERTGVYTLGEIVVTDKGEGVEAVNTVRELTTEDIRNTSARTLNEVLGLLPGLNIRTGADGIPRVDIRGFRSRHVLLLLNGIPFNSTFDGQFDPSIIATENIAKIKVSYGAHSVLYGQGGLGGVINIITKKGKKGIHGDALGEIGRKETYLAQGTLSGAQEKADFFVSGSWSDSDGFPLSNDFDSTPLEGGGLRENSDYERVNLFGNAGYQPTEKWDVGLVLNYLKGEFGKPPTTVDRNLDSVFGRNPRFERVDDYDGYSGQLSARYAFSERVQSRGWVFVNELDEDIRRYDDENYNSISQRGSFQADDQTKIRGGTVQTTVDLVSAGAFTVGLSGERQEFESDGEEVVRNGVAPIDLDENTKLYTTAIEYTVSPVKNVGVVLGYSHFWYRKEGGNDDDNSFLIGAHYDIAKRTRIRGAVARQIRFPSIRQLYEPGSGNPDLGPEKSLNYELGIEQSLPWNSQLALVGFYEDVEDYIERLPPDDRFLNNDEYRFRGFEFTAQTIPIKNLFLRGSYSYLDSKDKSPGAERDELQYRPKHRIVLEGRYRFDFGFSVYLNFLHVAKQYDYSNRAPLEKKRLNDYSLFNTRLDQTLFNSLLTLYAGADNLFDKDYEQSFGFPQAGRFVYGGVALKF
jgi:outer membrane cobalamin receptor